MKEAISHYINDEKTQSAISYGTSAGLTLGSVLAHLENALHLFGLLVGIAIGLLRLRHDWRNRNRRD